MATRVTKVEDVAPKPAETKPEPSSTVVLTSPWGSKVTVAAELADQFKDSGYTK